MIKIILMTITAVTIMFMNVNMSTAGNSWEMSIKVKSGNAANRLIIGQKPDATDGIDGRYDIPALLAGDIKAYMSIESDEYWKNIKVSCMSPCKKAWNIFVESDSMGQIDLIWDLSAIPDNVSINLINVETGDVMDMKTTQNEYIYHNTEGKREFIVEAQTW